jgi:hypothetical protein
VTGDPRSRASGHADEGSMDVQSRGADHVPVPSSKRHRRGIAIGRQFAPSWLDEPPPERKGSEKQRTKRTAASVADTRPTRTARTAKPTPHGRRATATQPKRDVFAGSYVPEWERRKAQGR